MQCVQQHFCYSCDEMYHRHPKRQAHVRKELDGGKLPPLPPKGEPPPAPVPPPRRNKRATPRPFLPPHPAAPPQRESVSPKPGLVGSLKRMMGVRPLPQAPHTMDRQNSLPPSSSMMNFHDQHLMNGFSDWSDGHRGHRSGSFSMMNPPQFGQMMQAQSMAQLSCPSCKGHGVWSPWSGGQSGAWGSQAALHGRQEWSDSDSDEGWQRPRRFSTVSARGCPTTPSGRRRHDPDAMSSRGGRKQDLETMSMHGGWRQDLDGRRQDFDTLSSRGGSRRQDLETLSSRGGSRRQDLETLSSRGGIRRQDLDTLSSHGGSRRQDLDTLSSRGGSRRQDLDTMSSRGGRWQDLETMSLRGGRRDQESPGLSYRRKFVEDRGQRSSRYRAERDVDSSDERDSDEDPTPRRGKKKVLSDLDDGRKGRRCSAPPSPIQQPIKKESTLQKKTKRDENFLDKSRRRSSPMDYELRKSSSGEDEKPESVDTLDDSNKKCENGIEYIDDNCEVEDVEEVASIPDSEWECKHCTFVNECGTRVCAVCCKTNTKPKIQENKSKQPKIQLDLQPLPQSKLQPKSQSKPVAKLEDDLKHLKLEDQNSKEDPLKNAKKEKNKERRGTDITEENHRTCTTSTGTSPPPQSISTQTYEEGGRKLKRTTSLADYSDWRGPQRSASRQSLLSDTQSLPVTPPRSLSPQHFMDKPSRRPSQHLVQSSLKRAGSQPPEYFSSIVQKQVKQGLEMVKLLREAEDKEFSAEDLAVALVHCAEEDPIVWLEENWRNMIDTVVTLATNYGQERKENTVGTISPSEARDALHTSDGNVWAAVTHCVEQRQKKYAELLSRGNFSREDIVTVLTANHGDLEEAYKELNKNQLKPFLMRIWGPPQGAENDDGDFTKLAHGEVEGRGGKNSEEVSVDLSVDNNYDRIEHWLEDIVYTNNKSNQSQPMAQLTPRGLKRSLSDWKVNYPLNNSRSNSTIVRNRRNSDIHRYLTTLYNANERTLLLNKHSMSTFNINNSGENNNSEFVEGSQAQINISERRLSLDSKRSEDNRTECIEIITVQLNPTVVKGESETGLKEGDGAGAAGEESSDSGSEESESGNSDSEEWVGDHPRSATPREGRQQLSAKGYPSYELFPTVHSDKQSVGRGLSRSRSQSSTESFESVHSSVDSELNRGSADRTKAKSDKKNKTSISKILKPADKEHISSENLKLSRDNSPFLELSADVDINLTTEYNQEEEIFAEPLNKEEPPFATKELEISQTTGLIPDIQNRPNAESIKDPSLEERNLTNTNSSQSAYETDDNYKDISSDEFVKDDPVFDKKGLSVVPIAVPEDLDGESKLSIFQTRSIKEVHSKSVGKSVKSSNKRAVKQYRNFLTAGKRKILARRQRPIRYAISKSDSDVNDRSMDFSEGNVDYEEEDEEISAPKATKRDLSLRFTGGSSDRDVSSIPTDSDREHEIDKQTKNPNTDKPASNANTNPKTSLQTNQSELLDILKKSLSNEDLIQKLVSTLFASVLQASIDPNTLEEQQKFVQSNKTLSQIIERSVDGRPQNNLELEEEGELNIFKEVALEKGVKLIINDHVESNVEESQYRIEEERRLPRTKESKESESVSQNLDNVTGSEAVVNAEERLSVEAGTESLRQDGTVNEPEENIAVLTSSSVVTLGAVQQAEQQEGEVKEEVHVPSNDDIKEESVLQTNEIFAGILEEIVAVLPHTVEQNEQSNLKINVLNTNILLDNNDNPQQNEFLEPVSQEEQIRKIENDPETSVDHGQLETYDPQTPVVDLVGYEGGINQGRITHIVPLSSQI